MNIKKLSLLITTLVLASGSLFAESDKYEKVMKSWTKEDREKMADIHMKYADCLKTDKDVMDCKKEMKTSCEEKMGKDKCPQMEKSMMKKMKEKMKKD